MHGTTDGPNSPAQLYTTPHGTTDMYRTGISGFNIPLGTL